MSDVKMSECFSLPITTKASRDCCDEWETLAYDSVGDFMFQLPDDICIDSVVTAINSYDSNQELIAKLQADNELLREALADLYEMTTPKHVYAAREALAATKKDK